MKRGAALVEFALAWPIALLIVLATVEAAVWAEEAYAARSAAIAGSRAGAVADGSAAVATAVTLHTLSSSLVGVVPAPWCPGMAVPPPPVWVCTADLGASIDVEVGGNVPALVPLAPGSSGLPLRAHVAVPKEEFTR